MVGQVELVRQVTSPPPPGASRSFYDGMPDYQRHAGSHWDFEGATQFALLFFLGLRQDHYLLDIGCGSLRAGRLLATYLLPGHYHGLDPVKWPGEVAVAEELGQDWLRIRAPVFSSDGDFNLNVFGRQFDFLLAYSIFTHASQAQVRKCLAEASKVTGPESVIAATYVRGEEDYAGQEWAWPNCVPYRPQTLLGMVEEAGLVCAHLDWPLYSPDGRHALLVIVRRGSEPLLSEIMAARAEGRVTIWDLHGKRDEAT